MPRPPNPVTVIAGRVGCDLVLEPLDPGLASLQRFVGGYLQFVPIGRGLGLWCNDDGMRLQLPFNRQIFGHDVVGNLFIARDDGEGELASVRPEDLRYVLGAHKFYGSAQP